uniref:Carbonyl reductase n=1 Tax=Panagrolaimus sp. ES5 TaxID=591445 RepID=A0AC34GA85_9BILA
MSQRIFVVTGANKGIGYGIVEKLASTIEGAITYLTARDESRGKAAIEKLEQSLAKDKKGEIRFHQLDIEDAASCQKLADYLKKTHDGIDVLVNNAGFAFGFDAKESAEEQAKVTIGINYYGTKLVSSKLIPIIRSGGRVVNVCSSMGIMKGQFDQKHIEKLKNASSEKEIDEFVEEYTQAARDDNRKEKGFPESSYRVSKAAAIALTLLHHRQYSNRGINFYACCPGYVSTDMTNH